MYSTVERLNEIKQKELEKKLQQKADGEKIEEPDLRALIRKKGSYASNPGDKARTHKHPIFTDRDF
jgi:hypothetical protein